MAEKRKDSIPDKNTLCKCLVHPFQDDPGTSQSQRIAEDLLGGKTAIDARKTADLLDFFYQLSMQVNYYDNNLIISDWRPFFEKSLPFVLSSMIRYRGQAIRKDFLDQCAAFEKNPTREGLQLVQLHIYYNTIQPLKTWSQKIKGSELPVERIFENIIKERISGPLSDFIKLNRLAAKFFSIKAIDFEDYFNNELWRLPSALQLAGELKNDGQNLPANDCERLEELYRQSQSLFNVFFGQIRVIAKAAGQSLEASFIPLSEDLRKKHLPHLALLFAFIKLFGKLQGQLNGFTKKHLDFFYREVLKLAPKEAIPDKAHIVFAIQKELDRYRVEKGVLLRDGRDVNKEDILFSLDEEIIVNQAQVKEVRTLHLHHQHIPAKDKAGSRQQALVEGVYMATNAAMADGVDKEFQTDVKNFYTLGNKDSKYVLPETKVIKPYQTARLGFVLASSVLFLEGGNRQITITLECEHDEKVCTKLDETDNPPSRKCCEEPVAVAPVAARSLRKPAFSTALLFKQPVRLFRPPLSVISDIRPVVAKDVISNEDKAEARLHKTATGKDAASEMQQDSQGIFGKVNELINKEYYYISQDLITVAVKKGLGRREEKVLRDFLSTTNEKDVAGAEKPYCFCPRVEEGFDAVIEKDVFEKKIGNSLDLVKEHIRKRKSFSLLFSGEKEWISPSEDIDTSTKFNITPVPNSNRFKFEIIATLHADKGPVVFFNGKNLKEELDTDLPLVKIELDDHVKLAYAYKGEENGCCLERKLKDGEIPFSFYHFFRDVRLLPETRIDVKVCGLKKMVVQNDESIMDVNAPVFPFGARPKITSNFYIGSKEVMCKNWEKLSVNFNWKNKPANLMAYYRGYEDILTGIKSEDFDELKFMYNASALKDGAWYHYQNPRYLFLPDFIGICGRADSLLNSCVGTGLILNNLIRRDCIDYRFIHKEYIKESLIAEDGSVKPEAIDTSNNSMKASSFRENIVPVGTPPIDYIPVKYVNDRYSYLFDSALFTTLSPVNRPSSFFQNEAFSFSSRDGFLRMSLDVQDFQHSRYSYILARQMMADGKLPNIYIGPEYDGVNPQNTSVIKMLPYGELFRTILNSSEVAKNIAQRLAQNPGILHSFLTTYQNGGSPSGNFNFPINFNQDDFKKALGDPLPGVVPNPVPPDIFDKDDTDPNKLNKYLLSFIINHFNDPYLKDIVEKIKFAQTTRVVIPNEPYTPQITDLELDYTAFASVNDINLIHLYPFPDTYKAEQIEFRPALLPTFCDEGYLFLGLEKLVPGSNLSILFQMAEATADSEEGKEEVKWHYLDDDVWKRLRPGFELLNDETEHLTTTGIVKIAMPENMTSSNTVMPSGLHWIRASIRSNSRAASETTGIHTQAVQATFTNSIANDKLRLNKPIDAEQISKLEVADASIRQVKQPYETFGGQVPEEQGGYYVRISEMLRHKGRAIQKFDYERIILNAFPQIFRAKCINHSFGLNANLYEQDFPYAPGYIVLAVIPDLFRMKAGNSFEPKVPVSVLQKIDEYVRRRISPFVRFRAMNPRYEKIHLCLRVKLVAGKDEVYYKQKLQDDVRRFLAPWTVGTEYLFKLAFGACVNRSTIVGFIESLDYIDFIAEMKMRHESQDVYKKDSGDLSEICPVTPRSILIGGDIEVCIIEQCREEWEKCTEPDRAGCCDTLEAVTELCNPDTRRKGIVT